MASVSRISGFRLVKNSLGASMTGQVELAFLPAADATVVMVGDVVKLLTGAASQQTGAPSVTRVAAGTDIPFGVVIGFAFEGVGDQINAPVVTNLNVPIYRAASTARYVYVCTDPNAIYEVQLLGSGLAAATVAAYIGKNAGPSVAAGSTATGSSGMSLDQATVATTATLPFKVWGFPNRPDNVAGDTYFSVWVKPNNFSSSNGTGSLGV